MEHQGVSWGNIPLEELASLPGFYMPSLSYDCQHIAYYGDQTGKMELYIQSAAAGTEARQVSHGELPATPRTAPVWTRDDKYILFAKDAGGDEQHNIWRINVESGDAEQLTDNSDAQEYPIEVSPDNANLLVMANLKGQMNLFLLNLATKDYTRLTEYDNPAGSAQFSPDGSQIVYSANETDNFKNSDIYLMNIDGSNKQQIFSMKKGSSESVSDWSEDGNVLAVNSDAFGKNRAGIYHLASNEITWVTPEDKTMYAGEISPDGNALLVGENEDSSVGARVYKNIQQSDADAIEEVAVELPPGMTYGTEWLDNERFLVNITTDVTRPELRDYRLQDGASNVIIAAEYGNIDPALFVAHEYITYKSLDGLEIPAIVYRPRDSEPGKTYPALVNIHGGPTAQFFRGFNPFVQFMADNGYIVIQPNVRGSTGYGVEFRDMGLNDWGGGDLDDVEAAAKYLSDLPEVDSERIGIWGGSYGGYMTFMAVTKKPHLWKAAVANVGITDIKKLYDSSMEHFKYYLRQQMGDPEENADLWYDRSAVNFAHQMTSNLFIMHGINDPRCPIEQARIFRDALVEAGKVEGEDFEYLEQGDQGHGSADIDHKIKSYNLMIDYFGRRL